MEPSDRDRLIDKVLRGAMTPDEAEAEAARLGVGPLSEEPDPKFFNPLTRTWWSLVMTVAWIAWRSADAVRAAWDEYRGECWDWVPRRWRAGAEGPIHDGYQLQQRRRATPLELTIWDAADMKDRKFIYGFSKVDAAKRSLWQALGEGLLAATGNNLGSGSQVAIPAQEWAALDWYERQGEDPVRVSNSRIDARTGYERVHVRSAEIIAIWPPPGPVQDALPATVPPTGAGHMTVYQAAQWIATRGDTVMFPPDDVAAWRDAYDVLLRFLSSGEIGVTGLYEGERRVIDPVHFVGITVDYPFAQPPPQLRSTNELFLRSYPTLDDELWRAGFDDSLCNRRGARWTKLMVAKADIAGQWPFSHPNVGQGLTPTRTGAPGRPTSMHLVEGEFRRRCDAGEILSGVGQEAAHLAAWLRSAHPLAPPLTPKAIENNIRHEYRRVRSVPQK